MLSIDQVAAICGSINNREQHPFKASYYHISGGYDVANAKAVLVGFSTEESRDQFVKEFGDSEYMAAVA